MSLILLCIGISISPEILLPSWLLLHEHLVALSAACYTGLFEVSANNHHLLRFSPFSYNHELYQDKIIFTQIVFVIFKKILVKHNKTQASQGQLEPLNSRTASCASRKRKCAKNNNRCSVYSCQHYKENTKQAC